MDIKILELIIMFDFIRRWRLRRAAEWHKWDRIPETPVFYLNEEQWKDFIKFALRMKPGIDQANLWLRIQAKLWEVKIKYFLRGWYGFYDEMPPEKGQAIYLREKTFDPVILHHEMGHIIQRQHKWYSPGIMNPVFFFRWFT